MAAVVSVKALFSTTDTLAGVGCCVITGWVPVKRTRIGMSTSNTKPVATLPTPTRKAVVV